MSDGQKENNNTQSSYGATYTTNDVIGIALDMDAGTVTFYKNNSSQGQAFSGLSGAFCFAGSPYNSGTHVWNFGQRAWVYTAPSGFKAVCTANLPVPLVTKSNTAMDVALYTGNGSTQTISGLAFEPDLVWVKMRSGNDRNILSDVVRGITNVLNSDSTRDEATATEGNQITSVTSTGFTVGSNGNVNQSSSTFVGWCWDAGTSTTTINANAYSAGVPSITSQVRANATAGFSVVTYTGNLSSSGTSTVGHGLNVAPSMIITKKRSGTSDWAVQHSGLPSANSLLFLNSTAAIYTSTWGTIVAPTSSVFTIAWLTAMGDSGSDYVAYCFAPVSGYSSFGSYVGNGSSDGVFVYTGMRPRFLIYKRTDAADTFGWVMIDSARDTYNAAFRYLGANVSTAEGTSTVVDFLSNGFKLRLAGADGNVSGGTYIYAAFAEAPFNYSRAR
jgi:hypothetical protein